MATMDIEVYDALTAANVPADKARAAAVALERRLSEGKVDLVTNAELGTAVDRLETQIESVRIRLETQIENVRTGLKADIERLDTRITTEVARLDAKIDARFDTLNIQITMIKWFMGMQVAVTLGILWALLRLMR